jgi:hypothetical protein
VLAERRHEAIATLLSDASHFEGALAVARGDAVAWLGDEPFPRVFSARILRVKAGLLGRVPAPAEPATR